MATRPSPKKAMAKRAENPGKRTDPKKVEREFQMGILDEIARSRQAPDTEHPISELRRLDKKAPPRKRGAKVIGHTKGPYPI